MALNLNIKIKDKEYSHFKIIAIFLNFHDLEITLHIGLLNQEKEVIKTITLNEKLPENKNPFTISEQSKSKKNILSIAYNYLKTKNIITEIGHGLVEIAPKSGIGTVIFSHDWCKPETWYQESILQEDIELIEEDGSDGKIWIIPNTKADTPIRQNNTSYSLGDKIRPTDNKYFYWHYECIEAGTSANSDPVHYPRKLNFEFMDGTVKWKAIKPVILIDVSNTKVSSEIDLRSTYLPKVYVNSIQKQDSTFHWLTEFNDCIAKGMPINEAIQYLDGDYYIDYSGKVIFKEIQISPITINFYKSNTSGFTIHPYPNSNKILRIKTAEAQFSDDIRVRDGMKITFSAYNGSYPLKITQYESLRNYIDESNKSYPTIPKSDLNSGDFEPCGYDLMQDTRPFQWEYVTTADLKDSLQMSAKFELLNDCPFWGSYATMSLYIEVEDENV